MRTWPPSTRLPGRTPLRGRNLKTGDRAVRKSLSFFDEMLGEHHLGEARLPDYFSRAYLLLRPGGVFLNHGISRNPATPAQRGPTLISRYVFPDGELVPIGTTLSAAEGSGFEVRDVESLREHYDLTPGHWVRTVTQRAYPAILVVDESQHGLLHVPVIGRAERLDEHLAVPLGAPH